MRQQLPDQQQPEVIIINLKNNNAITRRPIRADSAIMHWTKEVVALRAQQRVLQIFDLASKQKLKSTNMAEDVVFWKWFSDRSLGLVTTSSVYHWDVFDPNQPEPRKVFERHGDLTGSQIISYRVSDDEKWSVLIGISQVAGRVVGTMQLFSVDRGVSQKIEGHAASFGKIRLEGAPADTKLFTFCNRTPTGAKLHIIEIDHQAANPPFPKKAVDVFFPEEATNDFPVAVQVSDKYKIIYMVTKYGFIHLYDLETGSAIFMNRISSDTVFTCASDVESTGIVGVNRKGQVLAVSLDEHAVIPFLLNNPELSQVALRLASRGSLPGAEPIYQQQFENQLRNGQYAEAAKTAANSPQGFLRTPETIERFKSVPAQAGALSVILQYFGMLLDKGKLNQHETIELARPVLAQNRKHLLEKWMSEGKLGCSEQLGDLVRPYDLNLAMQIYKDAAVPQKVIAAMAESGNFDQILPYSKEAGYTPDFNGLLQHIVRVNPEKGAEFATALAKEDAGLIDTTRVLDVFQSQGMIQQATAFGLDVLSANRPEDGPLQTRLIEMNLMNAPQVADAILGNEMFSHYDRPRVAQLCEQAGLMSRALEHYEDPASIKRVIVQTDKIPEEFLIGYFGRLTVDLALDCLNEMLRVNIRQNLQAVINISKKYSDLFEPHRIIDLLEKYRTAEGLYYYLGGIVNITEDKEVTFKYIEAATRMGQMQEVERVCRESCKYYFLFLQPSLASLTGVSLPLDKSHPERTFWTSVTSPST